MSWLQQQKQPELTLTTEALISETDWTYADELDLLKDDITIIADQLRADETKKMLAVIEVRRCIIRFFQWCSS